MDSGATFDRDAEAVECQGPGDGSGGAKEVEEPGPVGQPSDSSEEERLQQVQLRSEKLQDGAAAVVNQQPVPLAMLPPFRHPCCAAATALCRCAETLSNAHRS